MGLIRGIFGLIGGVISLVVGIIGAVVGVVFGILGVVLSAGCASIVLVGICLILPVVIILAIIF